MFGHLTLKREVVEKLVERGYRYSDIRRRMGHPIGPNDASIIHQADCLVQDDPRATEVTLPQGDVDRLYELKRRTRWLDRPLISRIFNFYIVASYVLFLPLVFPNPCFVVFAPLLTLAMPFWLIHEFSGDPMLGARILSIIVIGVFLSWHLTEAIWLGVISKARISLILVSWIAAMWLMLTQFENGSLLREVTGGL